MKNPEFYNALSENYDDMLGFDNALQKRKDILSKLIDSKFKNAIDIGCGTGLDSVSLALNGLKVTGFDTSKLMISKARKNAKERNLNIRFISAPFSKVNITKSQKADLVVSLGNAFANIKEKELIGIIKLAYSVLNEGGSFLFQVLNYDLIRKENKRIVNITSRNSNTFIRFYDIEKKLLRFNILTINNTNTSDFNLISTELYEHNKIWFNRGLKKSGFKKIKYMGDFAGSPFNVNKSKDLIVLAVK
ncbi:MAG: methyltransferase domain-containing protein [Candidatus Kapaibacterium sp.]